MKNKIIKNKLLKISLLLILTLLILLLGLFSALAQQEGCFTYEESQSYCLDIQIDQSLEECLNLGCTPDEVFFLGQSCQDFTQFPQCEKINCKSSCTFEYSGKCSAGAIPAGEDKQWCSPGCCQFVYSGNHYCDFKEKKWLCEIEAKNKNVAPFTFDTATNQKECQALCQSTLSQKKETGNLTNVTVSATTASTKEEMKDDSTNDYFYLTILLVIAILSLIGLFYYFLKKGIISLKILESKKELDLPKEEIPAGFLEKIFFRKRLEELKEKRVHKIKEKHREDFFTGAGLALEKSAENEVSKLKKLVKFHERKKYFQPKKTVPTEKITEESSFKKLERLLGKNEQKEVQDKKAQSLREAEKKEKEKKREEAEKALKKLKEIAQKKK